MSASQILKDTFYRDKLLSLSSTEQTLNLEKKKLKELGKKPLTAEQIANGLSHLGKLATGTGYGYLVLQLINLNLFSIEGLEKYNNLQNIDLSRNNLSSLKPLSSLKYLINLNVSGNKLGKLLDFTPPFNLEDVDFSDNEIKEIPDLSKFRFLRKINLSQNNILKIEGISKNYYLQELIIDNNKLQKIENLDNLNLISLHLQGNFLKNITGLSNLPKLRILDLSRNQISKLSGLNDLISLRNLHLSDNVIKNVKELKHISMLFYLSILDLCFNPIQQRRFYRFQVLYILPRLRILDGMNITHEEIVKSENFYGGELEEKKKLFKMTLEEEEFIDRRINHSDLVDPESDSDNEEINFVDKYDGVGNMLKKDWKSVQQLTDSNESIGKTGFKSEKFLIHNHENY